MTTEPSKKEIDSVIDKCIELNNESMYPGMTYEQGVKAGIDWMQGNYGEFRATPLD